MRNSATDPRSTRSTLALLLAGLLLAVYCVGESGSAAAQMGGFGHMGGGGGAGAGPNMGGGPAGRMPPGIGGGGGGGIGPGRGGGLVGQPPGMGGWPLGGPPMGGGVIGGGGYVGGGAIGGGDGGRNARRGNNNGGGGGGAPAQSNQPFVADEIVTAFAAGATPQAINRIAQRYGLTQLESQSFPLIGASLYRWRIGGRRSVTTVVRALGGESVVASVQPNYVFILQEQMIPAASAPQGDAAQYVLEKLQIEPAHHIATGKNVAIAVIDSTIDAKHPDLDGTIVKSFDALGGGDNPHAHGTSIAGAIASHRKLIGIAPGAQLLAIHAFDDSPGVAKGTSFAIYKGLQWAADNGARVVNMSFAGPADPMLQKMLAAAYDKGIALIAAAGNAGPQSAPLYPAADPDVIAVTATDSDDHLFAGANRGRHIAVAAPGVDILVLAPGGKYRLTTGTSVAAAHVSGIAALLLERKPELKPSDIRAVLIATAKPVGPPRPDSDFGAGLVSAYRAVTWLDRKPAESGDAQAKQ
jgi:hypothetical protein